MKEKQKFQKGDYVRVAKDLGPCMTHFESDCDAIVIGSYSDQYSGDDIKSYTIYIEGHDETSWYYEGQLTLKEKNRLDILSKWKKEAKEIYKLESDLDWIFSHGDDILKSVSGSSVEALASCLGLTDLWGSKGEGFTYYSNAYAVLGIAKPFLEKNDKNGWLGKCNEIKEEIS